MRTKLISRFEAVPHWSFVCVYQHGTGVCRSTVVAVAILHAGISVWFSVTVHAGWTPGVRTLLVTTWLAPLIGTSLARYAHLPLVPLVLLALFWVCWHRLRLTIVAPLPRTRA